MLKAKISPSLMCADLTDIKNTLRIFEKCGVEYLHADVMDGVYVPNFMLCDGIMRQIRKHTKIPFDYHLMVSEPVSKLDWFELRENDIVTVHYESTPHVQRALSKIRSLGGRAGLALNPSSPVEWTEYLLDDIDVLLIMTVNPGFAGQKLVPQTIRKIRAARKYLDEHGYRDTILEVDGSVSYENATKMREAGADLFVAGTSSVFRADRTIEEGLLGLRNAIGGAVS